MTAGPEYPGGFGEYRPKIGYMGQGQTGDHQVREVVGQSAAPEVDPPRRRLGREIAEGAHWVYRHEMLRPMAIWTHVWFFFNAIATTVFVPYLVRELGIGAFGVGVAYACAGIGSVLGGALAGKQDEGWALARR